MPHDYLRDLDALGVDRPVIFYDQIGCGKSDRPDNPGLWKLSTFVDEVDTVRDALDLERVHVLGQSAGGWIALEYALRAPAGLVSLNLANTCASAPLYQREVRRLKDGLPGGAGAVIDAHEAAGTTNDPAYIAAVNVFEADHFFRCDPPPDHVRYALANMNPDIYAAMIGSSWEFNNLAGWDVTNRLGELDVPVLVTSGRYDEMTPQVVGPMVAAIRGARWVIFEDSAHLPMVSEKDAFIAVVREFLLHVS